MIGVVDENLHLDKMKDIRVQVILLDLIIFHTWHCVSEPLEIGMLVLRLLLLCSLIRSHHTLTPFTRSLALHCSLCSRAALCSLLCSFALYLLPSSWASVIYTVESRNSGSQRTNNSIQYRRISAIASVGIKEKFTQRTENLFLL